MLSKYFKERKGFNRLFILLKDKYISLGRFSGTVTLKNVSEEESVDLSNFFGKTIKPYSDFKTSFAVITKKLKETKYADFSWEKLFLDYFGYEVVCKNNLKMKFEKEEKEFYDSVMEINPKFAPFLENVLKSREGLYKLFLRRYKKNKDEFKSDLIWVLRLISMVPWVTPISLTMLASFSGNPHFLDFSTSNSTLFFKILSAYEGESEPLTTNSKISFLEKHGIYIDMFSNYVITYGLKSDCDFISSFSVSNQALNLNLSNLRNVNILDTDLKKVFVFENPSMLPVFMKLNVPVIITSGMPNAVFYETIEKLIASGNEIFYNGDFDPEGLVIASKIKKKFPSIKLFCYCMEDYMAAKSSERISTSSLKKLDGIKDEGLEIIKFLLLKYGYAAYQEKNIKRIYDFVLKKRK